MPTKRKKKKEIAGILAKDNWRELFVQLVEENPWEFSGALFSLLYDSDRVLKSRAILAFGIISSRTGIEEAEKLRVLLRRCIWMLTEESGGIPWGTPEVIGEILSKNEKMALEFQNLLFSYIHDVEGGPENYLEFTPLRKGVYFGISRLAESFPQIAKEHEAIIRQRFEAEKDNEILVYLCRIAANSGMKDLIKYIAALTEKEESVSIFDNDEIKEVILGDEAKESLNIIENL